MHFKKRKRFFSFILIIFLLSICISGCNLLENTQFVLTTGLSKNELFKVGTAVCTLPEAMLYLKWVY